MSFKDHFSGHANAYAKLSPRLSGRAVRLSRHADATAGRRARLRHRQRPGGGRAGRIISRWWSRAMAACLSCRTPSSIRTLRTSAISPSSRRCARHCRSGRRRASRALVRSRTFLSRSEARAETRRRAGVVDLWPRSRRAAASMRSCATSIATSSAATGRRSGAGWRSAYRDLPFPLQEIDAPTFQLNLQWDLDSLIGYIGTWSAVQRYKRATGEDPLPALRAEIAPCWASPIEAKTVTWPLHLRVGRAIWQPMMPHHDIAQISLGSPHDIG